MSSTTDASAGRAQIAARTLRTDRWWLPPLATFVGLIAWVALRDRALVPAGNYFVSRVQLPDAVLLAVRLGRLRARGRRTSARFLPDVLAGCPTRRSSLPFLLLFRLTCYYYRKAYYRAFWLSPPACAVAEPHAKYTGETRFPLIVQNLHRYFFYAAVSSR